MKSDKNNIMSRATAKAAKLITFTHKSHVGAEILEDNNENRLVSACATRWNYQLISIRSVLKLKTTTMALFPPEYQLTRYELNALKDLVEILEPFETATLQLEGDKYVTSPLVIPVARQMKAEMVALSAKYGTNKVLKALKASVDTRMTPYEDMECFQLATMLDPKFKTLWCRNDDEATVMRNLLVQVKNTV